MKLLTIDADPKTSKGSRLGYLTAVMYLAPYKLSGYQVCPMAEVAGCINDCLNTAGRGGMARLDEDSITVDGFTVKLNAIQRARIARTRFFFEDRAGFMAQLKTEIRAAEKRAKKLGLTLVVRLNGTSDIRWEATDIFSTFSHLRFYDYTKIANRDVAGIPNYSLTFSLSARPEFEKHFERAQAYYGAAMTYAVVFEKAIPANYRGMRVINGDTHDLRFLDETGVVVGLKAKGRGRKSGSDFVVRN